MLIALTGKAYDEGSTQGDERELRTDKSKELLELFARTATIHRFEQISIDMLERNIEIVADILMRHHDIEQLFINMFRLNVEHAKPGGRKRRSKAVEQPGKTALWFEIAPPDAGILRDEHDLLRALANELRYFSMNSFVGKAVIAATNEGDRTE